MKRVVLSAFLGGIVAFGWGAVSWTVLPWHGKTLQRFADEEAVAKVIWDQARVNGAYMLPNYDRAAGPEAAAASKSLMRRGPVAFAVVDLRGADPDSMGIQMGFGIALHLLMALFIALLLRQFAAGYLRRVFLVTSIAGIGGLLVYLPQWNWFHFPLDFTLVGIADLLIGWLLAGLVMAAIQRD